MNISIKNSRIARAIKTFRGYSLKKKILLTSAVVFAVLITMPFVTYAYFARDISDRERLMNRNSTGIQLADRNGKVFYTLGRVNEQNNTTLSDIPDHLEEAAIASEDKDFYSHPGFSAKGIGAALYANILNKDATKYGGSTITQQLVKNNLLTSGKNFLRKYQEFSIAIAVDRYYSKEDILEMYLNSVYFGEGAFGIESAAKAYFNKDPKDLTLAESSLLIGILPAPSAYSPISGDAEEAKLQQDRVLKQMVENKFITAAERDQALGQTLTYQSAPDAVNGSAEHYSQMVITELNERYGEERVARSGYRVTTGLDFGWQQEAEKQVKQRVSQLEDQGGRNASLVAIDPDNGEIRALVGSADWDNPTFGKVNMAVTPRQPGSSFKPIYHAEAMAKKIITPATILKDRPKTYGDYEPQNYDFKFMGDISTRRALAQSRNLTSLQVIEKLGVEEAAAAAQRMGIDTIDEPEKYGLTLALGTAEATLMDMTNAYAAFANEGMQNPPVTITSIKDKFDREIFKHEPEEKQVQTKEASYLISSILSDTQARAPTFSSLNIPGRTVAVKTGTTDDNKDAWTIGYSPSIAVGVWVGNNENEAMSGVAGTSGAGPIWRGTMLQILANTKAETFTQPAGVERVLVCGGNGFRAAAPGDGTYNEFFIKGTAPTQTCNVPPPKVEKKDEQEEDKQEEDKTEEEPKDTKPTPKPVAEICDDGKDNDADGLIDTQDPDCAEEEEPIEPQPAEPTPGEPTEPTPQQTSPRQQKPPKDGTQ